jgi:hypothetical protein
MKKFLIVFVILFSLKASTKNIEATLLEKVLSDSIIFNYMSEYGGIDSVEFVLSHHSGNYYYNHGIVKFEEHKCENAPHYSGMINKFKFKKNKAIVKIYFTEMNNYYSKVILTREIGNDPWRIKSRLIYRNFHFPRNQPRLFHYSLN